MHVFRWILALWTRFWFSVQMAGHGILANPLRSTLTILGVAIGVASVVALMGIGEGARQTVVDQFKSLGTNVILIEAQDPTVEFQPEEAQELVDRVEGLEMATPVVQTEAVMRWRRARGQVEIVGVNSQFPEIRDHPLLSGHFFTKWHEDQRAPVAVLGYNIGIGLADGRDPVGSTFIMAGRTYRIVGVLSPKGQDKADGIDDKILIPYSSALSIAQKKTVEKIWAKAGSPEEADLAVVQLGRIFKRKLGLAQDAPTIVSPGQDEEMSIKEGLVRTEMAMEKPLPVEKAGPAVPEKQGSALPGAKGLITITSLNQLVQEADKANQVMTLLLGGIASVSLLVGGLGIMNIMLVAVTERTGEIGLRRALGAKQGDLLIQFILEALYLSGIGAIAGITAGIWGTNLFTQYGFETVISIRAIKIATIVALASGLMFGVYPAISASSVPPVEALKR